MQGRSIQEILYVASEEYNGDLAMITSFGYSGMVLLYTIKKMLPHLPIYFIDTGRHFQETIDFKNKIVREWGLNVTTIKTKHCENVLHEMIGDDMDLCCHYRKVEPFEKIMGKYEAWINAVRKDQTKNRSVVDVVEIDVKGCVKINPLYNWDKDQTWNYIKKHNIPYNPLYDQNYKSIGCKPCTVKTGDSGDERAGRWIKTDKDECGLHVYSEYSQQSEYYISQIIKKVGIHKYKIIGRDRMFNHPVSILNGDKDGIAYCASNRFSKKDITGSKASVVITDIDFKEEQKDKTIIVYDRPRQAFLRLLLCCFPYRIEKGKIHLSSTIHRGANIHHTATIGANCSIGKCVIGKNTVVHPNCIINDNVIIGRNVIVGPDCTIGYDGFAFCKDKEHELVKFLHYGGVVIEDDVELFSKVNIVRGTLDDTIIRKGSKIGNYCNIGHNVLLGVNNQLSIGVSISGNTNVGEGNYFGPNCIIKNGINLGDNNLIGMGSVVVKDIKDGLVVYGNPAKVRRKNNG